MLDEKTHLFEANRRTLEGLAYRMLGTLADAKDVVQDTYLKWDGVDLDEVAHPRAWLIKVCTRLALNVLNSARRRREGYVGTWLPEPFAIAECGPADRMELDESVSIALLLALEKLTPPERAAYLLHDVFEYDFRHVAGVLGMSQANCRKLASRARARVRSEKPRFAASPDEHQRLLTGFLQAAHAGELDSLQRLFAESVQLYADGGGKVEAALRVLDGAEVVARFLVGVWARFAEAGVSVSASEVWFNGCPGLLITEDGELATAITFDVADGLVERIYAVRNPDKLAHVTMARPPDR